MRLSRSMHPHIRDFEAERADLQKGYENEAAMYSEAFEKDQAFFNDPTIPLETRQAKLAAYKAEAERMKSEYTEAMNQLNEEEAQYLQEQGGDAYVGFAGDAAGYSGEDYCGLGPVSAPQSSQEQDNGYGF